MLDWIAEVVGASGAHRIGTLQSLWSGYGELFRVALDGGRAETAVVKFARPPAGVAADAGFLRKCRSYDVETAFYRDVATRCDDTCRVPLLYGARAAEREWVLVLEDLDAAGFSERANEVRGDVLDATLAWLASFHARFIGESFPALWPIGTYWHLDTRRDELPAIADAELRAAAPILAEKLASARYQALLHGDAKDANFCISESGQVAAVDFQYAGRGPGIVDVAYLLYGRADEPSNGIDEKRLATYFRHLRAALPSNVEGAAVEAEWRALYPIARLDFCRFLAGWRPRTWQSDRRGQQFVRATLRA